MDLKETVLILMKIIKKILKDQEILKRM